MKYDYLEIGGHYVKALFLLQVFLHNFPSLFHRPYPFPVGAWNACYRDGMENRYTKWHTRRTENREKREGWGAEEQNKGVGGGRSGGGSGWWWEGVVAGGGWWWEDSGGVEERDHGG